MIAKEIMTRDIITVEPTMPVKKLAMTLIKNQISGAPVVAKKGKDVKAIMSKKVISVAEDTPIEEIAQLMSKNRIQRLPVINRDKIVGIVSRADIVNAIAMGKHVTLSSPVYDL